MLCQCASVLTMLPTILLSCTLAVVRGYSGGPPASACDSMTPGAPHQPNSLTAGEQREPPYILAANKDRRSGQINGGRSRLNDRVTFPPVFLRTAVDEVIFRGFMIMAEVGGGWVAGSGWPVPAFHQVHGERGHGYFYPALQSKELAGTLDCAKLPATCPDPTRAACQVTSRGVPG